MAQKTVKEMIIDFLDLHKCEGLCYDDCGCGKDNLAPCGSINENCVAAKVELDESGEEQFIPIEI
jgi:hypothetical protein